MSGIRSTIYDASAPLPKLVIHRSILGHELRKQRGTSKSMVLVPLFDLKFLHELAAGAVGTSNRRHQRRLRRNDHARDGREYVEVACATRSVSPSARIPTSPTARRLPSFMSRHSPISTPGGGFLRKLMFRFVVTASGTHPMDARMATYMVTSASCMRTGPETVPPGRVEFFRSSRRTRAPPCHTSTIAKPLPA